MNKFIHHQLDLEPPPYSESSMTTTRNIFSNHSKSDQGTARTIHGLFYEHIRQHLPSLAFPGRARSLALALIPLDISIPKDSKPHSNRHTNEILVGFPSNTTAMPIRLSDPSTHIQMWCEDNGSAMRELESLLGQELKARSFDLVEGRQITQSPRKSWSSPGRLDLREGQACVTVHMQTVVLRTESEMGLLESSNASAIVVSMDAGA